jgi:hypothetical protein
LRGTVSYNGKAFDLGWVDYTGCVRQQVLMQTGTAILAQANQSSREILKLLAA